MEGKIIPVPHLDFSLNDFIVCLNRYLILDERMRREELYDKPCSKNTIPIVTEMFQCRELYNKFRVEFNKYDIAFLHRELVEYEQGAASSAQASKTTTNQMGTKFLIKVISDINDILRLKYITPVLSEIESLKYDPHILGQILDLQI